MDDGFHNPYNFVPALPRARAAGTALGDRPPRAHGRYHADLWTGRIEVTMSTVTPLLLLDHAERRGGDREHRTYPVRVLEGNRPYVASTAVKGMLRTAYEMVTNSRFGVFDGDRRLGYRRETDTARGLRAVRIQNGLIHFLERARLPLYGRVRQRGQYLDTKRLPLHGESASAVVRRGTVLEIAQNDASRLRGSPVVKGWTHVTGQNIKGKLYERFFYEPPGGGGRVESLDEHPHLERNWRELMQDAVEANGSRPERPEPDRPEWSLHLRPEEGRAIREFRPPLLAYAELRGTEIVALYPVLVARGLFDKRPRDFLDETLRPASTLEELSPADRVFGWVADGEGGAHRGQLRVGPVEPGQGSEPRRISGGLTLAALSGPKPTQGRFYLGDTNAASGSVPQPGGRSKVEAGYAATEARTLRGRKVYPHQRDGRDYASAEPTDQNATVEGWVPPGARFSFTIDVTNLDDVELGALVWLLTRDGLCFKLGAGKPLGFGSVRLEMASAELALGRDLAARYRAFGAEVAPQTPDTAALSKAFEAALTVAYGPDLPFIASFLAAGRGVEGPVHYPRLAPKAEPDGKGFEWFTRNESGRRLSLPNLTDGERLPYDPR